MWSESTKRRGYMKIDNVFSEIKNAIMMHNSERLGDLPQWILFSNGLKIRFNSKLRVFYSGKTSCTCCGKGKDAESLFFKYQKDTGLNLYVKSNWKSILMTVDHNLLKSLGGSSFAANLNAMCEECNNLRGNFFAEMDEFIYWYHHPKKHKDLPKKNFSYIDGRDGEKEFFKSYKLPFYE